MSTLLLVWFQIVFAKAACIGEFWGKEGAEGLIRVVDIIIEDQSQPAQTALG